MHRLKYPAAADRGLLFSLCLEKEHMLFDWRKKNTSRQNVQHMAGPKKTLKQNRQQHHIPPADLSPALSDSRIDSFCFFGRIILYTLVQNFSMLLSIPGSYPIHFSLSQIEKAINTQ